jgi:hypothetical protein
MNPSIAFISGGREVHGETEYDPLGKTVHEMSNGRTITRWHFIEALENMHDADADFICKLARRNNDKTVVEKAMCWEVLMEIAQKYWADVEERFEGVS